MKVLLFDSGFGVIPFLNLVFKNHINNDYYIEMEEDFFPFGTKSYDEIINYAINKIALWNKEQYDQIYVICNTFGAILNDFLNVNKMKYHLIIDNNEETIKDKKCDILCTKITGHYFKKRGFNYIDGSHLVELIENEDIINLIKEIKNLTFNSESVILGCTHFTHIKFLLEKYHPLVRFKDNYSLLIDELINDENISIHYNQKAKKYINLFFSHTELTQ